MTSKSPPKVEVFNLGKRFAAFTALDSVSLTVEPGTFHVLLGENGAGKSTLVKCLMGYQRPDTGAVMINDQEVELTSPRHANRRGLGMVYQHFTVVPNLSVAENLILARDPLPWLTRSSTLKHEVETFMKGAPFQLPLEVPVATLAAGQRQKLEILKQMWAGYKFLILDEPTSVLTPQEADDVLGLMRGLVNKGQLSVLMITHKFREVETYADQVTVLRRGRRVGGGPTASFDRARLSALMMEGHLDSVSSQRAAPASAVTEATPATETTSAPEAVIDKATNPAGPVLELVKVCIMGDVGVPVVTDLNLSVRPGEILGIAGISGNGQREILEAIAGQRPISSGAIRFQGEPLPMRGPRRRRLGLRCVPEEPLRNGCAGTMSVRDNLALHIFDQPMATRWGWLLRGSVLDQRARALIDAFQVRPPDPSRLIASLSGGNVQRAVLARALDGAPAALVVANPCFGLDVRAVAHIRQALRTARAQGAAVLLISEDLDEILELSDRLIVVCAGVVTHSTTPAQTSPQALGPYLAGVA